MSPSQGLTPPSQRGAAPLPPGIGPAVPPTLVSSRLPRGPRLACDSLLSLAVAALRLARGTGACPAWLDEPSSLPTHGRPCPDALSPFCQAPPRILPILTVPKSASEACQLSVPKASGIYPWVPSTPAPPHTIPVSSCCLPGTSPQCSVQ